MSLKARPEGLSPLSTQVYEVLDQHTSFPWPALKTQAERAGFNPSLLSKADLAKILDALVVSVERFSNPANGAALRGKLLKLCA